MTKKEYLESLREYLSFDLPERLIKENITYYSSYFDEQMRLGKSQEEISEELGDPQLIAKSCIDAATAGADGIPGSGDEVDFSEEIAREKAGYRRADTSAGSGVENSRTSDSSTEEKTGFRNKLGCLIPVAVVIILLLLVAAFFSTPFGGALLEILLGIALISGILRIFRRK